MGQVTELHKAYLDASSKSDHFLLGAIAAACAYLAQSNPYGKIGLNPETLFLIDLIVLGLAAFFAHKRIENTIQVLKFNTTFLQGRNDGDPVSYLGGKQLAEKYANRTVSNYTFRNLFMVLGFILYVVAKVWRAY
ncbi:hypothetical protein GHO26_15495 [Pseudomonas helleri]|uniref:hypothetical protein n=1 Tax=Pseudomonas helleri TaxID=1608996 RepID=UPI0012980F88|nr:hypothetical protein [Pseudomonas helleri]MQU59176.1 hypothetical protein [Pseudomonas helleri]